MDVVEGELVHRPAEIMITVSLVSVLFCIIPSPSAVPNPNDVRILPCWLSLALHRSLRGEDDKLSSERNKIIFMLCFCSGQPENW